MSPLQKLTSYLDERKIPYEIIHHKRDFTAQRTAADTHTPGKAFAKTVILVVDGKFGMFVLPAMLKIDLEKVKHELGAKEVRLATESEFSGICTNCEVGAMPPFGTLYNLPVYVSPLITEDQLITFNAGTHEDVVRMRYNDYEKLVQPVVMNFTVDR
ncbi:MAG: YbaK/EbsC family protein [candidate division KSB1 bacterium]|nr:YbaK/EbsC family protein [candidate division KSB1 bacterium]MDZ7305092.1 YbaK/EbsC family protein [candidate division KSB1 bacterium]MDZ7313409.1 YbaK/EbsC family protein [candidate division KSB1 bacterium]